MTDPGNVADPVDTFREAWRRGRSPDLSEYLTCAEPDTRLELLRTDQHYRWHSGDRVGAAAYVARLPADAVEDALVLIWGEVRLRRAAGESPTANEYAAQFPQWADDLARLFELEQAAGALLGSTAPAGAAPTDSGPLTLAGYELLGEVGRGAAGVVYKARHVTLGRVVALKVIRTDADDAARPHREATLAARLQHPNIVQVFEFTADDRRAVIAMEYVEGRTLARAAGGLPQPPREVARQVETLAAAVHFAHQNGVIHRDLKPSNVLVSESGVLKVADFGLARPTDATVRTAIGTVVGTPAYMAPEQARGEANTAGPAADVYALGAILYELLTGGPPFRAETPLATLHQVLHADPTAPSRLQPRVPRDLETVCLKCLEKDPARRYPSAAALAEDLRRFQAGESILARPAGPAGKAWRWARRNPAWATTAASLAALLVGVAAAGVVAAILTEVARGHEAAARRDADERLGESRIAQARALRSANELNARRDALALLDEEARTLPPADRRDGPAATRAEVLRTEYTAALALHDFRSVHKWPGWPPGTFGVAFSNDLRTYARSDVSGSITVRRVEGDEELARFQGPGPSGHSGLRLSPDGSLLAVYFPTDATGGPAYQLWLWRVNHPTTPPSKWYGNSVVRGLSFSADGRYLAALMGRSAVVMNARTGRPAHRYTSPSGGQVAAAAFHPTEPRLAVADGSNVFAFDLPVWDPTGGAAVAGPIFEKIISHVLTPTSAWLALTHPAQVAHLAWAADGRTLAAACDDLGIYLWDAVDADPKPRGLEHPSYRGRLAGHRETGMHTAFDRTGDLLASNDWQAKLRVWDARSHRPLFETPAAAPSYQLRFGAADARLAGAVEGEQMSLFEARLSREFRTLALPDGRLQYDEPWYGCADRDGRLLVTAFDGRLVFWDLVAGRAVGRCDRRGTFPIRFEPDGSLVTSGPGGLLVWPVRPDPADPSVRRVGAPANRSSDRGLYLDPQSGTGLTVRPGGTTEFTAILPERVGDLPGQASRSLAIRQYDVRSVRVSPDGRWLAAVTHWIEPGTRARVKVWSAADGRHVKDFGLDHETRVLFSPDNRWLATDGNGTQLWHVGTWAEGPRIGGRRPVFSRSGDLVAVSREGEQGAVTLHAADTGREVARLIAPGRVRTMPLCFTPDGSRLAVWGTDSEAVHVWDLRAVREQLKSRGLDWDWPELDPDPIGPDPAPLRIVFD